MPYRMFLSLSETLALLHCQLLRSPFALEDVVPGVGYIDPYDYFPAELYGFFGETIACRGT